MSTASGISEKSFNRDRMDRTVLWRLMPLLMICYVFSNLDRVNIGFAKMQMNMDLNFSDTIYGLGAGLFFVAYALFGLPSNMALEKFGVKRWVCITMIFWGTLSAGMFLVKTANEFYVLRFLLGVAEAGFFPGVMLYITRWFPTRKRATMTAWFTLAVPVAGILGGPISGWIIQGMNNLHGLHGWQWMFIMEGVPVILLALVVLKYLPDTIANAKWLTAEEKQNLSAEIAAEEKGKGKAVTSFAGIFLNKYIWILMGMYAAVRLSINTLAFWTPTFIHSAHISSPTTIGYLSSLPYVTGMIFMFFIGKSSDNKGERRWHLFIPMMLAAVGLGIAGAFSGSVIGVVIGLMLAGMGANAALPLYWQFPAAFLSAQTLAAGLAIISSFGSIASFVAPYVIGWIRDNVADQGMALYLVSALIMLGSLMVFLIPAARVNIRKPAPSEVSVSATGTSALVSTTSN